MPFFIFAAEAEASATDKYRKMIKRVMKVIGQIELYLGINEDIIQIQEGETSDAPITLRQQLLYMDEEYGSTLNDGLDFKNIEEFKDALFDAVENLIEHKLSNPGRELIMSYFNDMDGDSSLERAVKAMEKYTHDDLIDKEGFYHDRYYGSGRIFTSIKTISFWVYPSSMDELKRICNDNSI